MTQTHIGLRKIRMKINCVNKLVQFIMYLCTYVFIMYLCTKHQNLLFGSEICAHFTIRVQSATIIIIPIANYSYGIAL